MFAMSRMRCGSGANWIQKFLFPRRDVLPHFDFFLEKMGHTEACPSELLFRQQLLPIENQLPRAGPVRLPDLEKMTGLSCLRPRIGTRAVAVGEIGAAAHVCFHHLHGYPGLLRSEEFGPVLFSDRGKRAVPI